MIPLGSKSILFNILNQRNIVQCSIIFFFVVVSCGDQPYLAHSSGAMAGPPTYQATAHYTCLSGFMFPNGATSAESSCRETGNWTVIGTCEGW